nr:FAD binding domain-containing protein [Mesorhizobium sp.]
MRYIRPLSIEDAVGLLAGSGGTAAILAGVSDLLVRMKGGFIKPDLIVNIKAIDGLGKSQGIGGGLQHRCGGLLRPDESLVMMCRGGRPHHQVIFT